ncbi:MAG: PASTA domain-containing protein [Polyangiales bacterium]
MDGDYIPGQRRPGFFSVVFVSALTSSVVSVVTVGLLLRYGASLGPITLAAQPQHEPDVQVARVPDVVGISAEAADELLAARKLRLVVKERRADTTVPSGAVITQNPLAQSRIAPGGEISVVLSTGPARAQIPDLAGQPLDKAKESIEAVGLKVGQVSDSDSAQGTPGTVVTTSPAAGTTLDQGAVVSMTVVRQAVAVPRLLGQHIRKAREMVTKAGLTVGEVSEIYDEHRRGNLVLSQEPEPGSHLAPGGKVNLVVNQGD